MVKVLVVGQTPPPFGGQIMMTKMLLDASYEDIRLFHAPMSFSREMDEIGKFVFLNKIHIRGIEAMEISCKTKYQIKKEVNELAS